MFKVGDIVEPAGEWKTHLGFKRDKIKKVEVIKVVGSNYFRGKLIEGIPHDGKWCAGWVNGSSTDCGSNYARIDEFKSNCNLSNSAFKIYQKTESEKDSEFIQSITENKQILLLL